MVILSKNTSDHWKINLSITDVFFKKKKNQEDIWGGKGKGRNRGIEI